MIGDVMFGVRQPGQVDGAQRDNINAGEGGDPYERGLAVVDLDSEDRGLVAGDVPVDLRGGCSHKPG